MTLGCVASLLSYSSPLPHGGLLSQASPLVNGSVAVAGDRRSSGPGSPAAWYFTLSWHLGSVRSARRKVVTSLQSRSLVLVGLLLPFPVFRSRGSVTAIFTLFGGGLALPHTSSQSTAPWWHLGRPRRRIALPW